MGELRLAIEEPSVWATVQDAARLAPVTVLAPLLLVCSGAAVLRRLARPVADVQTRLAGNCPRSHRPTRPARAGAARDAASLGWNRIVDRVNDLERQEAGGGLAAVLEQAAAVRTDARFEEVLQRL